MASLFETRTAKFSPNCAYRYSLDISWDVDKKSVNFLMLNPSTADEYKNDPTVERCCRRAKEWGYGSVTITNLFALRSTDPSALYSHPDPEGPSNDAVILRCAKRSDMVVCAWGNHGRFMERSRDVVGLLQSEGVQLHCLKVAKTGEPCHPLYLPYSLKPLPYNGFVV